MQAPNHTPKWQVFAVGALTALVALVTMAQTISPNLNTTTFTRGFLTNTTASGARATLGIGSLTNEVLNSPIVTNGTFNGITLTGFTTNTGTNISVQINVSGALTANTLVVSNSTVLSNVTINGLTVSGFSTNSGTNFSTAQNISGALAVNNLVASNSTVLSNVTINGLTLSGFSTNSGTNFSTAQNISGALAVGSLTVTNSDTNLAGLGVAGGVVVNAGITNNGIQTNRLKFSVGTNAVFGSGADPYSLGVIVAGGIGSRDRSYFINTNGIHMVEIHPGSVTGVGDDAISFVGSAYVSGTYIPMALSARQNSNDLYTSTDGSVKIGTSIRLNSQINTATGNQQLNVNAGRSSFAQTVTTLTIHNSLATTNSIVTASPLTQDATGVNIAAKAGLTNIIFSVAANTAGVLNFNWILVNP